MMPFMIGVVGLGADVGLWLYKRQTLQAAADSAALSGATASYFNGNSATSQEVSAVAASYGFTNGALGFSRQVSQPPSSGNYTANPDAVEVILTQTATGLFSTLMGINSTTVKARAVAIANAGTGCTLSLNRSGAGTTVQGSAQVTLNGCDMYDDSSDPTGLTVGGSSRVVARSVYASGGISGTDQIQVTDTIATNQPFANDPYSGVPLPSYSGCDQHNYTAKNTVTLSPGVFCGGLSLNAGAVVTLNPGTYIMSGGNLSVNGGASLSGSGVTLVFTSNNGQNYANATINGGATVNLTAPTSGPTAGIVVYADRNTPAGTAFKFNGGAQQYFGGAVYVPTGSVSFAGGANTSTGCTQLIGGSLTFTGNSQLSINCSAYKVRPLGTPVARLVE
jgi:Flp pilus assembly protein TadG